jgi:hypothetical protein
VDCSRLFGRQLARRTGVGLVGEDESRRQFLIAMYQEMWNNINRHITVVWQSIGVVAGAVALLTFVSDRLISLDVATDLFVLLAIWQIAHTIDAAGWYNRNNHIIQNIERQFLSADDLEEIHPYFQKSRKPRMIEHLKMQALFGTGLLVIALANHFNERLLPTLDAGKPHFTPGMVVPYVLATVGVAILMWVRHYYTKQHNKLVQDAPGKHIMTPADASH